MPALATVAMVAARVGEPIVTVEDVKLAESVLDLASELVRFHAQQPTWTAATAPALAVSITVEAAYRAYLNPSGFDMERGDMVTFNRAEAYSAGVELTQKEVSIIKAIGRTGNVRSVGMANSDRPIPRSHPFVADRGYAPVDWGGNKPFPLGYW